MKTFLLGLTTAALAVAVPAGAVTVVGATKVTITNVANTWLQVAEVQAFNFASTNVALATNGGSAVGGTGTWDGTSTAGKAIDGNTGGGFYTDTIFHPGTEAGGFLDVSFAAPTTLQSLTIWGRTDCCTDRDVYNVTIFGGSTVLYSGTINAAGQPGTVTFDAPAIVPEPQSWALMIVGFGLVGVSLRRRKSVAVSA